MRTLTTLLALMFTLAACAEKAPTPVTIKAPTTTTTFQAGTHYFVLDAPVRTSDPNKIEVTEVFWYGCSHCFNFEPLVQQWKTKQSNDVNFVRSPAMWREPMETHARAFFTAKALNIEEKMHMPLFNALNVEHKKLENTEQLSKFFASHGIEKETFMKAFNSFGVSSQVKQADARARSYKITGTPEMIVNGQYRVSGRSAGGQAEMLKVVDFLIQKIRAEKK